MALAASRGWGISTAWGWTCGGWPGSKKEDGEGDDEETNRAYGPCSPLHQWVSPRLCSDSAGRPHLVA